MEMQKKLVLGLFINLPFSQLANLSTCHFINLSFHKGAHSSNCFLWICCHLINL